LADLDSGRVEVITEPDQPGHWSAPHWLGDDLLVSSSDAGVEFHSVRAFDVGQGAWTVLLDADDQDRTGIPSPDGQRMAVVSRNDGVDRLEVRALPRVDGAPELGATTEVTLPGAGVVDFRTPLVWSPDSSAFGFTFQSPVSAPEVYVWSGDEAAERRTVSNDAATTADLVVPVSHRVSTPDGERVPVFVLPGRHTDGSAVVLIHGGPEAAAVRGWNPIIAGLALAGHTVVVPNVRGSAGYGRRWISLDDVDKRLDSVADLAAIHAWLPEIGVDQHRVALYGASYGGYMVLAGLAFQPELWAAGVDVVGISSLVTFLRNTSPYRRAYREKEYGRLDRDLEMLEAASPINRVNEIAAPLFVIHGANDPRVPLSEAEQLVAAVRSRGLECELHVYADEGHGLVKRTNRLDALPKAFSFLRRHLGANESRSG
jgi:dipeptidyl aminopeptidase/acylaminoacyl peptidase